MGNNAAPRRLGKRGFQEVQEETVMRHQPNDQGKPGETSQWPRWEGPAETRPSGYVQGEADIFADDPIGEKKRRATDYPDDGKGQQQADTKESEDDR